MLDADACKVLIILGASGTGKSTAAQELGRQLGKSWLQVDDLRLTLQFSGLLRPDPQDDLDAFFDPVIWRGPTDANVQRLIRVAELMEPALRVVIHSHVVTHAPVILEGDGIHPRLARDERLEPLVEDGSIRFCCLSTPTREVIYRNMVSRNRGVEGLSESELIAQTKAYVSFGAWLEEESARAGIPITASVPHESLSERLLNVISQQG